MKPIGFVTELLSYRFIPPEFIFFVAQIPLMFWLVHAPSAELAAVLVGVNCIFVFGIHGLLSGTSSMDFGGTKGASTVTGLFNGVHYLSAYLTGRWLGWILDKAGWGGWAWSMVPFSVLGFLLMLSVWKESPLRKKPCPADQECAPPAA